MLKGLVMFIEVLENRQTLAQVHTAVNMNLGHGASSVHHVLSLYGPREGGCGSILTRLLLLVGFSFHR